MTRKQWSNGHEHRFPVYEGDFDKYDASSHTPETVEERRDKGVNFSYDGIDVCTSNNLKNLS